MADEQDLQATAAWFATSGKTHGANPWTVKNPAKAQTVSLTGPEAEPVTETPSREPFAIPDLDGAEPHVALMAAAGALRANDFDALVRIIGGEPMYQRLEAGWSQSPAGMVSEEDRAEFAALTQMLTSDDAEEQLMAMLEPQLSLLKAQLDPLIEMAQGMAAAKLEQAPGLEEEGSKQFLEALDSVAQWLRKTDITSPERARRAIGVVVTLARELKLSTLDALAELEFSEALDKAGIALAGIKQLLAIYELSLDEILDSFEARTLSSDAEQALVRTRILLFGTPYETESIFVMVDGRWKPEEALATLDEVTTDQPGAPAADPSVPQVELEAVFAAMEQSISAADEAGFRARWHPRGYVENLVGDSGLPGSDVFAEGASEGWYLKPDTAAAVAGLGGYIVPADVWSNERGKALDSVYALVVHHEGNWVVLGAGEDLAEVQALAERSPSMAAGLAGQPAPTAPVAAASAAVVPDEAVEPIAADAAPGGFDLVDVAGMLYEQMVVEPDSGSAAGLSEVLRIPDRNLLVAWMTWEVRWDEQADSFTIDSDNLVLVDANGAQLAPVGTLQQRAAFHSRVSDFRMRRPHKWEDDPSQRYHWNAVFAVPRDSSSFTLRVGELEGVVRVERSVMPVYDPSEMAGVRVLDAKFVDELRSSVRAADQKLATTIRPLSNKLLAVTLALTPSTGNTQTRERFVWYTNWLGLIIDDGRYVPAVGETYSGGFGANVSHAVDKEMDTWETDITTVYFVVPAHTTSFELTLLTTPVATGTAPGTFSDAVATVSESADPAADAPDVAVGDSAETSGAAVTEELESASAEAPPSPATPESDESESVAAAVPANEQETSIAPQPPTLPVAEETEPVAAQRAADIPVVSLPQPDQKQLVRTIQLRLAELGYDPGPADGIAGRGTRQAVREYQNTADIEADGKPTAALLEHMQSASAAVKPVSSLPWSGSTEPVVGVAAFTNTSDASWWSPGAGEALADLLGLDMTDAQRLAAADRAAVDSVIRGQIPADGLSPSIREQLRTRTGADFLVVGTVTEFIQEKGGVSVAGFGIGEKEARITMRLRLFNVVTGKVERSQVITEASAGVGFRLGIYKDGFRDALKSQRRTAAGKAIRAGVEHSVDYLECTILTAGPCS